MHEKYYAIRVGDPKKHKPYLWCGEDGSSPQLFESREEAEEVESSGFEGTPTKVVRVNLVFSA